MNYDEIMRSLDKIPLLQKENKELKRKYNQPNSIIALIGLFENENAEAITKMTNQYNKFTSIDGVENHQRIKTLEQEIENIKKTAYDHAVEFLKCNDFGNAKAIFKILSSLKYLDSRNKVKEVLKKEENYLLQKETTKEWIKKSAWITLAIIGGVTLIILLWSYLPIIGIIILIIVALGWLYG